jgi:putative DNA-invertase from lambdoid prophage Rac
MKVALYARVSTHDQHTLPLQRNTMRAYVKKRRWTLTMQVCEIGSGAMARPKREELLKAAHRRAIEVMVVWRLDRWERSLANLVVTLKALPELGVGFVSLTEAIDLTRPSGRAMAGMLAVFAEFERDIMRERVKAGRAQAPRGRADPRATTFCGEESTKHQDIIRARLEPVRNRPTGGHWQNLRATYSDIGHKPVSYFYTYLGCTRIRHHHDAAASYQGVQDFASSLHDRWSPPPMNMWENVGCAAGPEVALDTGAPSLSSSRTRSPCRPRQLSPLSTHVSI